MSNRFQRTALFAALLAFGLAGGVSAQTSGTAGSTSGSTAQSAPPHAGSTGMDKGAGSATSAARTTTDAKSSAAKSSDAKLSGGERRFVETAARHGMAEVQLGKLAQEKASNPQVKDFGRRMVEDHGKANDQLKQLASTKGIALPTEPDGKHKRLADKLAKQSGDTFDRTYMDAMVDDHKKDVKEFRDMAKSAKDADVRAFASAQLPTLEEHLKTAQGLDASMSASARKGTSTARSGDASGSTAHGSSTAASGTASGTGTMGAGTQAAQGGADRSSGSGSSSSKGGSATASGSK